MLRGVRNKYLKSTFLRNSLVLFSGNSVSLVLPFLLAPLITRLYSPEDFAGYELFAKLVALFVVISALRYEYAIILPKSDDESSGILKLCMRVLLYTSVISALIFIPFRSTIGEWLKSESLPELLWWLPVGVYLTGLLMVLNLYLMRLSMFKELAVNKVVATGFNHGSKYLLGYSMANSLGLVIGHIIGTAAPLVVLFRMKRIRSAIQSLRSNKSNLRALAIKYKEFPLVNGSHAFYDEVYKTGLIAAISIYYGDLTLGLFAFTFRYLRIPVQVFGSSLSQVFLPQLAADYNNNINLRPRVAKLMLLIGLVGVVPFLMLMFFGKPLFGLLFSDEWMEAGRFAEIMAPWLFFNFISSPISLLPTIVSRQRTFFLISLTGTLSTLCTIILMAWLGYGFIEALVGITAVSAAMDVFLIGWFIQIAGTKRMKEI